MTLKCRNFITYSQLDIIYKQAIYDVELQYISVSVVGVKRKYFQCEQRSFRWTRVVVGTRASYAVFPLTM